jgi:hypothetical protein
MAEINFNFEQYDGQIARSCMERIRKAAEVIAESARKKSVIGTVTRPLKPGQPEWMERSPGAMRDTIRTREKKGETGFVGRDVRVYAGNKKTWWATQMEYGRGGWKGGRKSFMRPALRATKSEVQNIIENG